jgi:hypothetical protein
VFSLFFCFYTHPIFDLRKFGNTHFRNHFFFINIFFKAKERVAIGYSFFVKISFSCRIPSVADDLKKFCSVAKLFSKCGSITNKSQFFGM